MTSIGCKTADKLWNGVELQTLNNKYLSENFGVDVMGRVAMGFDCNANNRCIKYNNIEFASCQSLGIPKCTVGSCF